VNLTIGYTTADIVPEINKAAIERTFLEWRRCGFCVWSWWLPRTMATGCDVTMTS